ncbi:hypothetical protein ABZ135_04395 [Streptomyces sp. NPDC006339]|uniref:hypothetical protein n=1 Tax=Streptomyces sp. NPDC006339 TaxID=3156755 RepID=UPI0033B18D8A
MLGRTMLAATALALTALTAPAAQPEPPGSDGDLRLTNESPASAEVKAGQRVIVSLTPTEADGLRFTYSAPESTDQAVLAPDREGEATNQFNAVTAGTADLTAVVTCEPVDEAHQCPAQVDPWTVTVTVQEPSPQP